MVYAGGKEKKRSVNTANVLQQIVNGVSIGNGRREKYDRFDSIVKANIDARCVTDAFENAKHVQFGNAFQHFIISKFYYQR